MEHKRLVWLVVMTTLFATSSTCFKLTGFLEKYGYLQKSDGSNRGEDRSPEDLDIAIRHFQAFAGLEVTGIVDQETQEKLKQSRCGVKDVVSEETPAGMPANLRRVEDRWPKLNLTWKVKKFSNTSTMPIKRQLYAIRQGFRRWEEITRLSFREVDHFTTLKVDIELSFEKVDHGDKDSFDGRGMTLAHAYSPVDGRTHFDDDEEWTEGVDHGTNLEHVATHEIGHALGLFHVPGMDPVMSPYYPGYIPNFNLHKYDISEIQRRYGKRKPLGSLTLSKFCGQDYETVNAAMRIDRKADYIFVDGKMVISGFSGRKTFVKKIFRNGPKTIDAAVFSVMANTIYLFKDKKVWAFHMRSPDRFILKNGFPKILENSKIKRPEAAIRVEDHDGMETIFLIKGGHVWTWMPYNENLAPGIGIPSNKLFPSIPQNLDAAISGENIVHFIVGKKFYTNKSIGRITSKRSIPVEKLLKCLHR